MVKPTRAGLLARLSSTICMMVLLTCVASASPGAQGELRRAQELYLAGEYKKAATLLIQAVEQGNEAAQLPLAAMYRSGQGVEQDLIQAFRLFSQAAHQGYPSAQYALGMMYRLGEGTQTDHRVAMKWFGRAASFDHAEAQNSLGVIYETGRGVKSSYVTALMWYHVAASRGSRRGRDNLNRLTNKMKTAQVARAKMLALTCERSRYKRCGHHIKH